MRGKIDLSYYHKGVDMSELVELLEYSRWATERILQAVSILSPEIYIKDLGNSFPSIRDTLVHIYGADRAWLGRVQGQNLGRVNPEHYPDVATLKADWSQVGSSWPEVIKKLNPQQVISYQSFDGTAYTSTLDEIIRHVVNHATYHRGQVTTMLKQQGMKPISTDLITFYRNRDD
jgi:uncharacterized damage-inducible protein DinB